MLWKVSVLVVNGKRYYNNGVNSIIGLILLLNEFLDDL